jgi:phosphopantothenoylcysteine synthetase/decarboxylase
MSEKNITLGVTGSIAAFKAAALCGMLVREGFGVTVIMTACAQKFVGPQTFLSLSRNPVVTDLWEIPDWKPGHIALADKTDLFLVAPCTANFIGKLASGIADDALTTFAISHSAPAVLAPAMNSKMWAHPAVVKNCETLRGRGVVFAGPVSGDLACGDRGDGRMLEPGGILGIVKKLLV